MTNLAYATMTTAALGAILTLAGCSDDAGGDGGRGDASGTGGAPTSTSAGPGGTDSAGGSGGGTRGADETAQEAIDRCLEDIDRTIECPNLGDANLAFAFDEPYLAAAAVCGDLGIHGDDPRITFIIGEDPDMLDGFVVLGIRIRSQNWRTAADGAWWELLAPEPILVRPDTPLAATLQGWTLHILTFPFGLGFLFQEGETTDVDLTFAAPVTTRNVLDGDPVQLNLAFRGGRYLRIMPETNARDLFDDPTGLGFACMHASADATIGPEFFGTVSCGPDFDDCGDGYQACAVSASNNLFVCEPATVCASNCPFDCGAIGGGSCLPPWGPGM